MELGATVCTPRSPSCGVCPLRSWCASYAAGTQAERPAPKAKKVAGPASFLNVMLSRPEPGRIVARIGEETIAGASIADEKFRGAGAEISDNE